MVRIWLEVWLKLWLIFADVKQNCTQITGKKSSQYQHYIATSILMSGFGTASFNVDPGLTVFFRTNKMTEPIVTYVLIKSQLTEIN